MSQASKFKDGKVLRSENTRLCVSELRMLYDVLESGANTIDDVQRLTDIGHKIEPALGEYYSKLYAARLASRAAIREGASEEHTSLSLGIISDRLDIEYGEEPVEDVVLTMVEWEWTADRWKNSKQFVGMREMRDRILRINDVVRHALGVKFINKQAWIENEPEPNTGRDNPGDSGNSNGAGTDHQEVGIAEQIRPLSFGNR